LTKSEIPADVPGVAASFRLSRLSRGGVSIVSEAGVVSCSVSNMESSPDEARFLPLERDGANILYFPRFDREFIVVDTRLLWFEGWFWMIVYLRG
jgi:hypothetical protein